SRHPAALGLTTGGASSPSASIAGPWPCGDTSDPGRLTPGIPAGRACRMTLTPSLWQRSGRRGDGSSKTVHDASRLSNESHLEGEQAADLAPDAGHQYNHVSAAPPYFAMCHGVGRLPSVPL